MLCVSSTRFIRVVGPDGPLASQGGRPMAHPSHSRRQLVAAVLLLMAIAWGLAVWVGVAGTRGADSTTAPWLLWHRVGSVTLTAALSIYLFLTATRSRGD